MTITVTIKAGVDFRGVHHYEPTDYDVSLSLGAYLIETGDADYKLHPSMLAAQEAGR